MGASLLPTPPQDLTMTKLLSAIRRTFGDTPYSEPKPHFHQGTSDSFPEVCFEGGCSRPHLKA
jgi:hypothetical protein